ncbi:MAG: hypothetical protein EX271_09745 [Acidimicrobiales bacterium]|nr:hypothetical protein [Hyphomonadaceae bacterium]RZV40687.1 MAG: hypothetical protein EX271_09745 [Acidimicrobiales bacterium]
MEAQSSLFSDMMLSVFVVGAFMAGMFAVETVRRHLCEEQFPDYNRHLIFAEHMFIDSEFDRARSYARNGTYPLWFRFVWIRDIAVIVMYTLATIFAVYFALMGIKMVTGGLVTTASGSRGFATSAFAPIVAATLGVTLGIRSTMELSFRSPHYREFAQYVASLSKKRGVVHLEHFYRAGMLSDQRVKREPDLLVMIHERYTHLIGTAVKITGGLTLTVFILDVVRGLF